MRPSPGSCSTTPATTTPLLRRFISPDTIVPDPGNPQDLNRYSYVRNNPVMYNDPTGNLPGWMKSVASGVTSTVSSAVSAVSESVSTAVAVATEVATDAASVAVRAVESTAQFVSDNSTAIALGLSVVSIVVGVANPIGLGLWAASTAFNAYDTYQSCSAGDTVSCGAGFVATLLGGVGGVVERAGIGVINAGDAVIDAGRAARSTAWAARSETGIIRATGAVLRGTATAARGQFLRAAGVGVKNSGRVLGVQVRLSALTTTSVVMVRPRFEHRRVVEGTCLSSGSSSWLGGNRHLGCGQLVSGCLAMSV